MFAIVEIAGFQEKVQEGDTLQVPLLVGEKDDKITLSNVLMIVKGDDDITFGAPFVSGASVELKILAHGRGEKIRVFRMRRRKRYSKTRGHRQDFTTVEVMKIAI
jgi:large subunit ribosomal protein L21